MNVITLSLGQLKGAGNTRMVSLEYQRVHTVYLGTITFNEWNASAVGPKVHKFQFKCIPEKSYIIFTLL